jgi:hypothetical protein
MSSYGLTGELSSYKTRTRREVDDIALRDIVEECQRWTGKCFRETPAQMLTGTVPTTNCCKRIRDKG